MFVVAQGISSTGGMDWLVTKVLGTPRSNSVALVRMMAATMLFSSFVNNTPVSGGAGLFGRRRRLPAGLPAGAGRQAGGAGVHRSARLRSTRLVLPPALLGRPLCVPHGTASPARMPSLPQVVCILLPIVLTWATKSKVGGWGGAWLVQAGRVAGAWPAPAASAAALPLRRRLSLPPPTVPWPSPPGAPPPTPRRSS